MAKADQLKALIKSHADGDHERFYAVAMQVAAQQARQGHSKFAKELRDLVDKAKSNYAVQSNGHMSPPIPLVQPRGELVGLLSASFPRTRLVDMCLGDEVKSRIDRILLEQRERDKIRAHGLAPFRKLLLIGPPGTGKTMTASVLSHELSLPLFTIQLDGLITKFLGETASKLRLIFDSIRDSRGVYLFDEFDALGSERSNTNEVGEIRRVLSSFLQFLENDDSDSILVAATNHPKLLDRALFRRFESVLEYQLPSKSIIQKIIRTKLVLLGTESLDWNKIMECSEGISQAELARACENAFKEAILAQRANIQTGDLIGAICERQAAQR